MTRARCDGCRFWQASKDDEEHLHADDRTGECHRHAPRPVGTTFQYEVLKHLTTLAWQIATEAEKETDFQDWEEPERGTVSWLETTGSDWCGEYEHDVSTTLPEA